MVLTRSLDAIHPDTIHRKGFVVSPGMRHQLTREWSYLIGARVGRKAGTGEATIRFFTSSLPTEPQSDNTQGQIVVDENAAGDEAGDDLIFASFEKGIFVEVHSTGATDTESFILTLAWVKRGEFTPAFGDPICQVREAWTAAPCREGELHENYPLGEDQEEWPAEVGGLWEGDGVDFIEDGEGDPILDSAGAGLYSTA